MPRPAKDDAIIIVGASIFGLSTALHLAYRGYKNVTVFDRKLDDKVLYSDPEKYQYQPIQCGYGTAPAYQDLALESFAGWNEWNEEVWSGKIVPPGMTKEDRVWVNNGHLSLMDGNALPSSEIDKVRKLEAAGLLSTQLITTDQDHCDSATSRMFNIDPFMRVDRGKPNAGVLDVLGGMALAGQAVRFAVHKARSLGVRFVLDPVAGAVDELSYDKSGGAKKVTGAKTQDGTVHAAGFVVFACATQAASELVPLLKCVLRTTPDLVLMVKIPIESGLWDRLAPDNFPSWTYRPHKDDVEGVLWGFPRDDDGWMKIGYRGLGNGLSGPQADGEAMLRGFLTEFLPELEEVGVPIAKPQWCWGTESLDKHHVVDRVPGTEHLLIAISGTRHDLMYLPAIGDWFVDVMEGKKLQRPAIKTWQWREPKESSYVKEAESAIPEIRLITKSKL